MLWLVALVALAAPRTPARAAPAVATHLEGLLMLPPLVLPGEELELELIDPRRTPPGGRWTIAGVLAEERDGRLRVRLPETLAPGQAITVVYDDPRGTRRVNVPSVEGVRVLPSAAPASPALSDCGARAPVGEVVCVCGSFPPGARRGLLIDGKPAGNPVSASSRVLLLRLPADLAPGAHVLSADARLGFPPGDQVLVEALRIRGRVDRPSLVRGQETTLEVQVAGTEVALGFQLTNHDPRVVTIDGGDEQAAATSGGTPNRVQRRLRGKRRGDFRIRHSLTPASCPCAGEGDLPTPPTRLLARVPLAPVPAMSALAATLAATHGLTVVEVHSLASIGEGLLVFTVAEAELPARLAALQKDPRARAAQRDQTYETAGQAVAADPLHYGRQLLGADRVPPEVDGRGVTVALVDTGVDTGHPQLRVTVAEQADMTGAGFTPDIHGTLLAGIIAAQIGDGHQPAGLAPAARLLAIKACQPASPRAIKARCTSSTLARGLDLALLRSAAVINLSLAGRKDALVGRLVEEAVRRGRVVVAAAGHAAEGEAPFPAVMEGVLAVTAVDARAEPYPPASRGAFVDLSAPGVEVASTAPGNQVAIFSGTSAAAAFVSGTVALLLQRPAPGATVRTALEQTARDLGPPGKDPQFGSGLTSVCPALRQASAGRVSCP